MSLAFPLVAAQLALPLVLLGLAPGWQRAGGPLAALLRITVVVHLSCVTLVEIGALALLEETARAPMRCGTGFGSLFLLMAALVGLSALAALLFGLCCARASTSKGGAGFVVFIGGVLTGCVLFSTWLAPFFFVEHLAIGVPAAFLAVVSTAATTLLSHRVTTDG